MQPELVSSARCDHIRNVWVASCEQDALTVQVNELLSLYLVHVLDVDRHEGRIGGVALVGDLPRHCGSTRCILLVGLACTALGNFALEFAQAIEVMHRLVELCALFLHWIVCVKYFSYDQIN